MCPGFGENYGELFGGDASNSAQAMITKALTAVKGVGVLKRHFRSTR